MKKRSGKSSFCHCYLSPSTHHCSINGSEYMGPCKPVASKHQAFHLLKLGGPYPSLSHAFRLPWKPNSTSSYLKNSFFLISLKSKLHMGQLSGCTCWTNICFFTLSSNIISFFFPKKLKLNDKYCTLKVDAIHYHFLHLQLTSWDINFCLKIKTQLPTMQ